MNTELDLSGGPERTFHVTMELWLSSTGSARLIARDDVLEATASVTVAPLSSGLVDAPQFRIRISPTDSSGVARENDVMVEKLTTVRGTHVQDRAGRVTAEQMSQTERSMTAFLRPAR